MNKLKSTSLSTGLAMFSMFFGAGNITFPLIIGQTVEGSLLWALAGLIITAVLIPFSGLLSITLFEGNYEKSLDGTEIISTKSLSDNKIPGLSGAPVIDSKEYLVGIMSIKYGKMERLSSIEYPQKILNNYLHVTE